MPKRRDPETVLQIQICRTVDRCKAPGVIYWHTPNGGKRSYAEAAEFAQMGLLPGVPDLVFIRPDGMAFTLEIKTPKGVLSDDQETFRDRILCTRAGWAVARSVEDALTTLREWKICR